MSMKQNKPRKWRVFFGFIGAVVLTVVAVVLPTACVSMGSRPGGDALERIKKDKLYKGGKFENPVRTEVMAPGGFWRMMSDWVGGKQVRAPREPVPMMKPDAVALARRPASGLAVTWLGHASMLVQMDEYRVLTDPVFSERATPVPGVGPKRFHPNPVLAKDLPHIHAVVISHDHYDHLDMPSIKQLIPRTDRFIVPLGVGANLRAWDVPEEKIVELGWWENYRVGKGLIVVATPARHFSGRGPLDRNKTQWASFAFIGRQRRVYFGGDTGLFDGFKQIGKYLGPFDVTLMPIGAYNQGWRAIHLNPEEAVAAHQDVKGKLMLPIHWGTFNLAFHSWTEPAERLLEAAKAAGIQVAVPRPGERITLDKIPAARRWWPKVPWERAPGSAPEAMAAGAGA